ncbi:MAG: hypothetical protein GXN99_00295 [Candidatus Nanohaloarchaeota archaeon]|nr:hypothetical protein [Candidatus Nanohaloarchaeota archaeon]
MKFFHAFSYKKKIFQSVKNHPYEIATFLLINAIFWISMPYPNWDFMAYFMNGKFFFGESTYFEIYRPPFVPLCLGILYLLTHSYMLTAFAFSLIASFTFIYAVNLLVKSYNLDKKTYYWVLFTTPLLWYAGLRVGTELMSVTFILLSLSFLKQKKNFLAGLALSLASLSRYELLILLPILLTTKNIKHLFVRMIGFGIPWLIWAAYSFYLWGSMTYSLLNSFALNIYFRDYLWQNPNPLHFLILGSSLLGGIYYLYLRIKNKSFKPPFSLKYELILAYMILALLYSYYKTPLKFERYLYSLIAPLSILASISLKKLFLNKSFFTRIMVILLTLFTMTAYIIALTSYLENKTIFERIDFLTSHNIINTSQYYYSDLWVHLNFHNIKSLPVEQLCRGKEVVVDPSLKYAVIFNYEYCLNSSHAQLIQETPHHIKIYFFNVSNISYQPILYLDHIKEISSKLKENVKKEVCLALFKVSALCGIPFI